MAANTTVAMVAWMGHPGLSRAATGLMAAAVYLPFIVLFAPLWLGALSPTGMLVGGHLLMLLAMAIRGVPRLPPGGSVVTAPREIHPVTRRKQVCGR